MINTFVYVNSDLYTHGKLTLNRSFGPFEQEEADHTIAMVVSKFQRKVFSEVHILRLDLDPKNGKTEVVINDYYQHPEKQKIIINAKAAPSSLLTKMLAQAI